MTDPVLALDSAGDGVWDWHLVTGEEYVSPRIKAMYGYGDGELLQGSNELDERTHPDDVPQMLADRAAHFDGRMPVYRTEHRIRIGRLAARTVVTAQAQEQVTFFPVQVVAQDHAAKTQVGLHVEQLAHVAIANQTHPKWHDLHVTTRTHAGNGELAEGTFHLDQAQHGGGVQAGAPALVPHGLQKLHAVLQVGLAAHQALAHAAEPAQVVQPGFGGGEVGHRRRRIGNGRRQGADELAARPYLARRGQMGR